MAEPHNQDPIRSSDFVLDEEKQLNDDVLQDDEIQVRSTFGQYHSQTPYLYKGKSRSSVPWKLAYPIDSQYQYIIHVRIRIQKRQRTESG